MFKKIWRTGRMSLLKGLVDGLVKGLLVASLTGAISACAAQPVWDGNGTLYNFGWTMSGNAGIAPVQVFDDGTHVYLQFADGRPLPVILADAPGGEILLTPRQQFPYIVIDHFETQLEFRMGSQRAWARRARPSGSAPQGVATGRAQPVVITGAAPMPVSRDMAIAGREQADARATASSETSSLPGVPPTLSPALSPVSPPVDSTVAATVVATLPPTDEAFSVPADARSHYLLARSDISVGQAFTRWSAGSGWTVRWDAMPVARITGDSQIDGPLLNAVITVVDALKQAGYPVDEQWDLPHQTVTIQDAGKRMVPHHKYRNRTSRRKA
ncbi:TrbG/VirB9 family P-type conjugative transfer protein [Paraburkholderia tropica]|uniref:TrbG/VirB9 family P-type conjugative transfer protein n=1 Tax=Paraburkholderia tropica TaxID=92647 RepID=UPI002AB76E0E|nr:TrbG/VirB9 family P-type conjugative transfer protein [Paraburkholderia tropica]